MLNAITGLTLTAANYREAIEVLEKCFGDKQQIVDKQMEVLLSVEVITSDTSLTALRHLYGTIETQVRRLKSMGVSSEEYGSLLSALVVSKIPLEVHLIINHEIDGEDWKFDNLMKILLTELRAQERELQPAT